MDISDFNKVLRFLDKVVLQSLDEDCNLRLKLSGDGGPGENVDATIIFESVCYIGLPVVMDAFTDYPQISICSISEARELLPPEALTQVFEIESRDGNLKTFRFHNGSQPLSYCVVCYGYRLSIDPQNWDWKGWLQWSEEKP